MSEARLTVGLKGSTRTLAVILGDQLDLEARALRELDPEQDAVVLMEVADEATHVASHKQRTALFLSAMRHFAIDLVERGMRVRYVKLDSRGNTQSLSGEILRAIEALRPERVTMTEPGEWRVRSMVEDLQDTTSVPIEMLPDEHFLTSTDEFAKWAHGRKSLIMEHFYRVQRRKLGVLVDEDGKPAGGRWNFDAENREAFRDRPDVPERFECRPDDLTRDVLRLVERRFPEAPGDLESFAWPVTRGDAKRALEHFVRHRLARFGEYQDAMWTDEPWLYHSTLSPVLNLKLLRVEECVEAALAAYEREEAPLPSVEGFLRQIIGWREFVRGVYWSEGPSYATRNELEQHGKLPPLYWSGKTDMRCLQECVGQVLEHGYGHHIQRLMVTGNFALIAGVQPQEVNDWYLGMYVDAVDWVTTPNTLGMVLHADGGRVGTKPYAASGRYIDRMSNYCLGCRYDPKKRSGEGDSEGRGAACPFTVFYWDFLIRQRERLRGNQRMALILKNVDRMDAQERESIRRRAEQIRDAIGVGAIESRGGTR